jgi:hypothetical protein
MRLPQIALHLPTPCMRSSLAILPEYTQRAPGRTGMRLGAILAVSGLALFCVLYGAIFSLVFPYAVVPLLAPMALALAVVVWILPESRTAPVGTIAALLFAYSAALILWPNYLAVALPGTPWITISRLIGAPLSFMLLVAVSTSAEVRTTIGKSMSAGRFVCTAFLVFLILQTFSIGLSRNTADSLNKFINAQFGWTSILFVSMLIFHKKKSRRQIAWVLWISIIVVALIGLVEWKEQHVLWAGHVPGFFHIDDAKLAAYMKGGFRPYSDIYRPQSTSTTALGFGEILAITSPFILYFIDSSENWPTRICAFVSTVFVFAAIYASDARSGLIGFSLSVAVSCLAAAVHRWRTQPNGIVGIAVTLSFPVLLLGGLIASFAVHRIRLKVWGGGAQAGSTDARVTQMHMGLPLVVKNPLGYGIGQDAAVLNFRLDSGMLTIDNYYLSVVLDYGVLGLMAFLAFVGGALFMSGRMALKSRLPSSDSRIYLAVFQSLLAFLFIKAVFSQQDNHPIIFMIIGLLLALLAQEPDTLAVNGKAVRKQ